MLISVLHACTCPAAPRRCRPQLQFYTAGFLGLVAGPTGPGAAIVSSPPVIVNEDARVVPNVNRFNGLWYRWCEWERPGGMRASPGPLYQLCASWPWRRGRDGIFTPPPSPVLSCS